MNQFKDFGIKPALQSLVGDKIKIDRVLNRKIIVHDYRLEDSKYGADNSKCLYLQIELESTKRLIFTSSTVLIDLIQRIPKSGFPFETTIIKDNERFEFI